MSRATRVCPPGARTAIFVEGGDDERMARRLLGAAPVFYQCFDGRTPENIGARVRAASKDPGWPNIRRVGVVLDAEEDLRESWALACSVFSELGIPAPSAPGVVEAAAGWTVGARLLPDNATRGASETLLLRTAPPAQIACIDAFFACTPNPGSTTAQRDKARAHALTAAVVAGGRPDQLWDRVAASHPALAPLHAFLAALA